MPKKETETTNKSTTRIQAHSHYSFAKNAHTIRLGEPGGRRNTICFCRTREEADAMKKLLNCILSQRNTDPAKKLLLDNFSSEKL